MIANMFVAAELKFDTMQPDSSIVFSNTIGSAVLFVYVLLVD